MATTTIFPSNENGNHSWSWFHGKITRDEAERLLRPSNPDSKDGLGKAVAISVCSIWHFLF